MTASEYNPQTMQMLVGGFVSRDTLAQFRQRTWPHASDLRGGRPIFIW